MISTWVAGIACTLAPMNSDQVEIDNALRKLRLEDGLYLNMTAVDTVSNKETSSTVNLYTYRSTGSPLPKIEIHSFVDGKLKSVVIADGERLWYYVRTANEYEMVRYQDASYLRSIQSITTGHERTVVRLLSEILSGSAGKPWLPLAKFESKVDAPDLLVTQRQVNQSVTFLLREDTTPGVPERDLIKIDGSLDAPGNLTQWTIHVHPNFVPQTKMFVFTPPAGSRAVVGSLSQTITRK